MGYQFHHWNEKETRVYTFEDGYEVECVTFSLRGVDIKAFEKQHGPLKFMKLNGKTIIAE